MQHSKHSREGEGTLYGAKITGGGSGGTVCIVGRNCLRSNEQIIQVPQKLVSLISAFKLELVSYTVLYMHDFPVLDEPTVVNMQIQKRYEGATGYLPIVFEGSSPGAGRFGHLRIRRRLRAK